MRIKIVKCEAQNAVNIGNIDKFCNEAVGDFKLMDAVHNLFRGSLQYTTNLSPMNLTKRNYSWVNPG
jgi:hypothetical protein